MPVSHGSLRYAGMPRAARRRRPDESCNKRAGLSARDHQNYKTDMCNKSMKKLLVWCNGLLSRR